MVLLLLLLKTALWSGPPHNYNYPSKEYGPMKENGKCIQCGSCGGQYKRVNSHLLCISYMNLGDAFEGIPLDKPLLPCVVLVYEGDSVELIVCLPF